MPEWPSSWTARRLVMAWGPGLLREPAVEALAAAAPQLKEWEQRGAEDTQAWRFGSPVGLLSLDSRIWSPWRSPVLCTPC
jgi:hypothetical protein